MTDKPRSSESEGRTSALPLLPLRGMMMFPHTVTPLEVGRPRSIEALEAAMMAERRIVLVAQKDEKLDEPTPDDIFNVGTLCEVKQVLKLPEGQLRVLVEGQERVYIDEIEQEDPFYTVVASPVETPPEEESEPTLEALRRTVGRLFEQYAQLSKKHPEESVRSVLSIEEPERLLNTIASTLAIDLADKQRVLELPGLIERFEHLSMLLTREIEILELEKRIHMRVRRQMEKTQREYYLREQMKAIQKELGEGDERQAEAEQYRRKIRAAKLTGEVRKKALHEVTRLEKMPPMAAEAVVVRNYLDWIIALPWNKRSTDREDIDAAQAVLDEDHYGLEKVKERILEYLAVRQLTKGVRAPIVCFVGPPGVGKTSLGRSIAKAVGREFVRISLGGVRDEAEIRGHRRTYVGSMPGRIVQALRQAGTRNPVLLLDEIDKMSADFRGDPASALLEVLDPEQNHAFSDHYLELPVDLSEVLFVTTANVLWNIPRPLRDRMEIITLPGYTEEEKVGIARHHLLPKQLEAHGLTAEQLHVSDNALVEIIRGYTKEAGVRSLERNLAALCRKVAREVVANKKAVVRVAKDGVARHLGPPRYLRPQKEQHDRVGLAHGLAYTEVGGDTLSIEVTVVTGKGKLILTGKLGDVMRESAQAGYSYVRSRAAELGIDENFYEKYDVHIHVPEGATPKNGPSAGITIATALASALTGRAARHDVAMTGEITLRGRVLAVGGIKEKLLAAHRAGVMTVIVPADNAKDLEDIPANIRRQLHIELVDHMDDVLKLALVSEVPMGTVPGVSAEDVEPEMAIVPGADGHATVPHAVGGPGATGGEAEDGTADDSKLPYVPETPPANGDSDIPYA